jgi:hypothetical protein
MTTIPNPVISLARASVSISHALECLLKCPEIFRPFVVVEVIGADRFVQFAGSSERGLLFDVPALGIVASPQPTLADAVQLTIETLRRLGAKDEDMVRVTFESTRNAPGRRPGSA